MDNVLTGKPNKQVFNSKGSEILDPRNCKEQMYCKNSKGELYAICGAKAKQRDWVCCQPAGAGTTHKGTGKCKFHGGSSHGAPKHNNNAVTHGLYKTIWVDKLSTNEKEYFDNSKIDSINEIDNQIKLANIRISQHMQDINEWQAEIVLMELNSSTMTKHDYVRRDKLSEWIPLKQAEITKIQLSIDRMLLTKQKLELELGTVDDQAEKNRQSFLDAAKPDKDLFDEINNDTSYIDNIGDDTDET